MFYVQPYVHCQIRQSNMITRILIEYKQVWYNSDIKWDEKKGKKGKKGKKLKGKDSDSFWLMCIEKIQIRYRVLYKDIQTHSQVFFSHLHLAFKKRTQKQSN